MAARYPRADRATRGRIRDVTASQARAVHARVARVLGRLTRPDPAEGQPEQADVLALFVGRHRLGQLVDHRYHALVTIDTPLAHAELHPCTAPSSGPFNPSSNAASETSITCGQSLARRRTQTPAVRK
jgi:hypothetical protein